MPDKDVPDDPSRADDAPRSVGDCVTVDVEDGSLNWFAPRIVIIGYVLSVCALCMLMSMTIFDYLFVSIVGLCYETMLLVLYTLIVYVVCFLYFLTYDVGKIVCKRWQDLEYNSTYAFVAGKDIAMSLLNIALLPFITYVWVISETVTGGFTFLAVLSISSAVGVITSLYAYHITDSSRFPVASISSNGQLEYISYILGLLLSFVEGWTHVILSYKDWEAILTKVVNPRSNSLSVTIRLIPNSSDYGIKVRQGRNVTCEVARCSENDAESSITEHPSSMSALLPNA